MSSILDTLENNQVDVLSIAQDREDISGINYTLNPVKYKYILILPMNQIEVELVKYYDMLPYVQLLDYLFSSFTHDYQILLRNISTSKEIKSKIFLKNDYDNYILRWDESILKEMAEQNYKGGIFIQFDTSTDWSFKKIYRFFCSLMNIVSYFEEIFVSSSKKIFLYRRKSETALLFGNNWNIEVLNTSLYEMSTFVNFKKLDDMSANEIVTKVYKNTKRLTEIIRHFVKPDFDNTPSDIQNYRNHIYHNLFKHARSNFTAESIKILSKDELKNQMYASD